MELGPQIAAALQLNCPLVFLDTETTGTHPEFDRIVQIAILKIRPDGRTTEWQSLINPGVPIPPEIVECHGITDDKVRAAPSFNDVARQIATGIQKCDFGGYNVDFDLRMLRAEFRRCGISSEVINGRIVDSNSIFHAKHRRTLTAAAKLYLNEDFEDAHDAMADTVMSARVFLKQLEVHPELPKDVEKLHREFSETRNFERYFSWRHGELCIDFGNKHVNRPLRDVAKTDSGYLKWIVREDFPWIVRQTARDALDGKFPVKEQQS